MHRYPPKRGSQQKKKVLFGAGEMSLSSPDKLVLEDRRRNWGVSGDSVTKGSGAELWKSLQVTPREGTCKFPECFNS